MNTAIAQLRESQFDFVYDSQRTFRTMMMALAYPGIIQRLDPISLSISKPDLEYILQPLLTLLDLETVFCVVCQDKKLQQAVTKYIEINTHSQSRKLQQADFILCLEPSLYGQFSQLKKGTLAQPNAGATVLYLLDSLSEQPTANAMKINLAGPGIKRVQTIYTGGLDPDEIEQWGHYRVEYPRGIDIYLVTRAGNLVGIPRSVNLKTGGR
jgi:alpha-D-ribose 1-methylphosphonate 5-triphosphate synthase subunit PhnH